MLDNAHEGHTRTELMAYYEDIVAVASKLLKENKQDWETNFKKYLERPDYYNHTEYWFQAYKNIIKKVEKETGASFYFTTQGTASLRFNGVSIIYDLRTARSRGQNVMGTIDNKSGYDLSNQKTIEILKKKVSCLKEKEASRLANQLESFYESGILRTMNDDNKKGRNTFYRHITPIKRLNNGFTGNKKQEIGLFQMATPFGASEFKNNPQELVYSSAAGGGGIDILSRRGRTRWDSILTLIEVKNGYERETEPPEITMGQLIAYAVFICNLLEKDPINWGHAFGYMSTEGYGKKELNLIVMLPVPNDEKPPREDFLSETKSGADLKVSAHNGEEYVFHLGYAYFDPTNYMEVKYSSLKSLDNNNRIEN